jgi:hypothetical protein
VQIVGDIQRPNSAAAQALLFGFDSPEKSKYLLRVDLVISKR